MFSHVPNRLLLELIGVPLITHTTSILIKKSMDSKTSTILGAIQGSGYWRMIGTTEQLIEKADAIGQRWLKGIGITRQLKKA
jgi:hypothetical protein